MSPHTKFSMFFFFSPSFTNVEMCGDYEVHLDVDYQEPIPVHLLHLSATDADRVCVFTSFFLKSTINTLVLRLSSEFFSMHHSARFFISSLSYQHL